MGSFRRGIRMFRAQEVIFESRPSFLGKTYPIKIIVELIIQILSILKKGLKRVLLNLYIILNHMIEEYE